MVSYIYTNIKKSSLKVSVQEFIDSIFDCGKVLVASQHDDTRESTLVVGIRHVVRPLVGDEWLDLAGRGAYRGMNLAGVTYYSSAWTFTDVFKAGGATSWPVVRSGTDENGYPLEIDPALDYEDGVYWITGRNILMVRTGCSKSIVN